MSESFGVVRLGPQRLPGVVFVPRRCAAPHSESPSDTGNSNVVHLATDYVGGTPRIRDRLLHEIRAAKDKVLFCSFLFADDAIVSALCETAERMRGGVYVLTALGKHLRPEIAEPDDDESDSRTARDAERSKRHEEHLRRLAAAGAWLRSVEDAHAKFCVVDDSVCVVTSANATEDAYTRNPEDGLLVRSPEIATELGRLFAHAWFNFASLESAPGPHPDVHSVTRGARAPWSPLRSDGDVNAVATLGSQERSLLDSAVRVIDSACSTLTIATYSLVGMEIHPIGAALERAIGREVRIDLLLQPRNHIDAQRACCEWLLRRGGRFVRLHGHRKTHTKSIVADGKRCLLWTGNLESAHGWTTGIEIGLTIADEGVARAVESFVRGVIARADREALDRPSCDDVCARGFPSAFQGDWTLETTRDVRREVLMQDLESCPVEVLDGGGRRFLRCGRTTIEIVIDQDARTVRAVSSTNGRATSLPRNAKVVGWGSNGTLRVVRGDASPIPPRTRRRERRK